MMPWMFTPIIPAVSGSSATARIPRPVWLDMTKRSRARYMAIIVPTMSNCWLDTL